MLFLSYAEEDAKTGVEVAKRLADQGLDVFYWQDPRRRGGRFIERIEKAIGQADAFVALLSPSFMASRWCQQERELAMQREHDLQAREPGSVFIHVLKISDTQAEQAGFLRSYDWRDLTSPQSWEQELRGLADRIRPGAAGPGPGIASPLPGLLAAESAFYGHRYDLDKVVAGLASESGPHFWLAIAPPALGKSWFLRRIGAAMAAPGNPGWTSHLVDVREEPSDVRTDANALLARLLGLAEVPAAGAEALRDAAADISESGRSCLCLLDSAELLDEQTSGALRASLSRIYRLLSPPGRLALVVASRRDDQWRGTVPDPRLTSLRLGELNDDDVRRALRDLASQMDARVSPAAVRQASDLVLRLSQGLPVLLARCLDWIRRERWLQMERLESDAVFDELAEPYVQQRLLTPDGLGRGSRGGAGQPRYALEQAFRVLAPYRLFTLSHLQHHVESDAVLRSSLENAAWSVEDLWRAIGDSALLAPMDETWREIHPGIRRLLFRYYYGSAELRARAHLAARAFVQEWTEHQLGKDQVVGMVECLWHEAAAIRLTGAGGALDELSASAERLFGTLQPAAAYSGAELRAYGAERLREDAEFQELVRGITGLATIVVAPTLSGYVPRPEELEIGKQLAMVRDDLRSRVVLLYGPGGAGKTWLVRQLALANAADRTTIWLDPIDLDDSESWLLSSLERGIARRLDPENRYFGPYQDYISRLPVYVRSPINPEAVLGHLGRIKRIFMECYTRFAAESGATVVMTFDTVEAIRGMYLVLTLTQWMKSLPSTLFILSGRENRRSPDQIRMELEDSYFSLPVTTVRMGGFGRQAALDYLSASGAGSALTDDEKAKVVLLTRGHPLWMAFTIAYLMEIGIPREVDDTPLADIERDLPYDAEMTSAGLRLHESFRRSLMVPYQQTGFWRQSVMRLAVVRQSISRTTWRALMSDCPLPDGVESVDQAWDALLRQPWIRPRANGRYLTLHDAMAEELAERVIPLHDQSKKWRRALWRRAADSYTELIDQGEAELETWFAALNVRLENLGQQLQSGDQPQDAMQADSIDEVSRLDARKRELDQLKAARLYYLLLHDFEVGCAEFLRLFSLARDRQDVSFQDLLAFEIQRFLPGGDLPGAVGEVIGGAVDEFRIWLTTEGVGFHLDIALCMADYLMANEQPATVAKLLDGLPPDAADQRQRWHMNLLRGEACMRIPSQVREAREYFRAALNDAEALATEDRSMLVARAHKELGFYYRNMGEWSDADLAYQKARDAVSSVLATATADDDRAEMASIQANWAYLKGLVGQYRDGINLVESAIAVQHRLHRWVEEGTSWSVCGEVYRYERRFHKAWDAYAEAERIFQEQRNWPGLGLIYQEQAICILQAVQDGIALVSDRDPVALAQRLTAIALDICRDQFVRAYPSALNRAGRIFGVDDTEEGLRYLADGIECARSLSDGWFWFANLIEYVELSYRAWRATASTEYLVKIDARAPDIEEVMSLYEFPDLRGRWRILQGHLAVHRSLETGDQGLLDTALDAYRAGFAMLAAEYVGSSGASAIPGEFRHFRDVLTRLPQDLRAHWLSDLRRAWTDDPGGSTLLLARLEELY
ncbi:MAG TPA: TIR domain-containing protein [Streptosporangiaceae bacterium]|nr:TIR domain-containing protein [Streptosporangiaceae bacterium]